MPNRILSVRLTDVTHDNIAKLAKLTGGTPNHVIVAGISELMHKHRLALARLDRAPIPNGSTVEPIINTFEANLNAAAKLIPAWQAVTARLKADWNMDLADEQRGLEQALDKLDPQWRMDA